MRICFEKIRSFKGSKVKLNNQRKTIIGTKFQLLKLYRRLNARLLAISLYQRQKLQGQHNPL